MTLHFTKLELDIIQLQGQSKTYFPTKIQTYTTRIIGDNTLLMKDNTQIVEDNTRIIEDTPHIISYNNLLEWYAQVTHDISNTQWTLAYPSRDHTRPIDIILSFIDL